MSSLSPLIWLTAKCAAVNVNIVLDIQEEVPTADGLVPEHTNGPNSGSAAGVHREGFVPEGAAHLDTPGLLAE